MRRCGISDSARGSGLGILQDAQSYSSHCLAATRIFFARTFGLGHMQYARYRNRCDHRIGHLWQGRSFAASLDEEYCSSAMRDIELNPMSAGLVTHPEDWR